MGNFVNPAKGIEFVVLFFAFGTGSNFKNISGQSIEYTYKYNSPEIDSTIEP